MYHFLVAILLQFNLLWAEQLWVPLNQSETQLQLLAHFEWSQFSKGVDWLYHLPNKSNLKCVA